MKCERLTDKAGGKARHRLHPPPFDGKLASVEYGRLSRLPPAQHMKRASLAAAVSRPGAADAVP